MLKRNHNTFANIELIRPNYIGFCYQCTEECFVLQHRTSHCKHKPKWVCSYCGRELEIVKIGKRKGKSLFKFISNAISKAVGMISSHNRKSLIKGFDL